MCGRVLWLGLRKARNAAWACASAHAAPALAGGALRTRTHLTMWFVSQLPRTFSPKLDASSAGKGSRAPKFCAAATAQGQAAPPQPARMWRAGGMRARCLLIRTHLAEQGLLAAAADGGGTSVAAAHDAGTAPGAGLGTAGK